MSRLQFFTLALFLSFSITCIAQANNMYLGPEGGPGLGILYGSAEAKQDRNPLPSGTAGYAFQYNFTQIFALRTDISYERAGAAYYYGGFRHLKNKFDYLTLPVLARATFGKKINFFVDGGPYIGALLREQDVTKDQNLPVTTVNNTGYFKRVDVGISEGVGILIPFGNSYGVSFEARNNAGLYNLPKSNQYVYQSNLRNNTTNFIFAFIYKLVTAKHPHNKQPVQKA